MKPDKIKKGGFTCLVIIIFALVIFCLVKNRNYLFGFTDSASKDEVNIVQVEDNQTSELAMESASAAEEQEKNISFIFGGDVMFDRKVDYNFRDDKIFQVVKNLDGVFANKDVAMVNNEGPISSVEISPNQDPNNLSFNFPPKSADVLAWLHINAVSLANNHTLNNGREGIERTRQILSSKNITPIGDESKFGDYSLGRFDNGQMKLTVIAINCLEDKTDLAALIMAEKATGAKVVIFPHWGTEYQPKHNLTQESLAKSWIDAGADLVVGSHPHVVEDAQIYKGKPVFYSMGNLVFDQDFSIPTQQGLIVGGKFTESGAVLNIMPTVSKNLQPELVTGVDKDKIVNKFREDLGLESCVSGSDCSEITLGF